MSQKKPTMLEEMSHLSQHYEERVRPHINLVDSLRSLGVESDLALPAIAVIGDQSSGKSSVLEALSGVALPRGPGIVTRCPLVLKLKRATNGILWYGVLSYKDIKVDIRNPAEVGNAITKAQNALTGKGKDISSEMINLEIHSTSVPDLTLIDLPGIVRIATDDQSQSTEEKIKRLIQTFIKKQETINLVVVPANVDIATTEALKMAKTVDPEGERTLGIVTKPDLVDKGAEESVISTLNNHAVRLKKGYMMVRCRGQQDINDNLPLAKALDKEREFFEDHAQFRVFLDEGKATISSLSEKLTKELVSHINTSLPHLERQIKEKLENASTELRMLGDGVPQDKAGRAKFLTEKLKSFNEVLTDMVRSEEDVGDSETRLFTKLRKEFSGWKTKLDEKAIRLEEELREEVRERGKELPGFVNYGTFEGIVRRHVQELEEPAMNLLQTATGIISTAVNKTTGSLFEAYPNLMRAVKVLLEDLKEQEYVRAKEQVKLQFKMEKIIYCQDGAYSSQLEAVRSRPTSSASSRFSISLLSKSDSKPINADIHEMAYHVKAYFRIASSRLADQVPMIVQFYMLEQYIDNVKTAMLDIRHKDAESFLQEKSDIAKKRKDLLGRMERLRKAHQLLVNSVLSV